MKRNPKPTLLSLLKKKVAAQKAEIDILQRLLQAANNNHAATRRVNEELMRLVRESELTTAKNNELHADEVRRLKALIQGRKK